MVNEEGGVVAAFELTVNGVLVPGCVISTASFGTEPFGDSLSSDEIAELRESSFYVGSDDYWRRFANREIKVDGSRVKKAAV